MSGSAEDEAKARLEVAQLYEGMPGQAVKAARYYFAAAEIYRGAGVVGRARELYQKVVQLDPGNTQANSILQQMMGSAAAAQSGARPAAGGPGAPGAPPRPPVQAASAASAAASTASASAGATAPKGGGGAVMVPTPWITREPRYVAAARAQLQSPPDRLEFPWEPLPTVDPAKVAARADARKLAMKEEARKSATRIESAFGAQASPFSAGAGSSRFGQAKQGTPAQPAARPGAPVPPAAAAQAPPPQAPPSRFSVGSVDIRGGNRDLADAIRRKLQGG